MTDQDKQFLDEFDPSHAVYTPSEVAAFGLAEIEKVRDDKERSLDLNIELVRDYFAPVRPGQVAGIVGQTSHYKSGLLHFIEHRAAEQISAEGRDNEAIIHVSLEEGVEEQAYLEFARVSGEEAGKLANGNVQDWQSLIGTSYRVANIPIYRIGDSIKRSEYIPKLYLTNVFTAISYLIKTFKVRPALIAIDYLQALPIDPEVKKFDYETQRRLQVRADAYRLREMAQRFACPVWVACQAKQSLGVYADGKGPSLLIPGMYDINESADVAQRFDRLIGIWLPARSYPIGTSLRIGSEEIKVTNNLLFLKVNKQRGGLPAGRTFICEVDFRTNTIMPRRFQE